MELRFAAGERRRCICSALDLAKRCICTRWDLNMSAWHGRAWERAWGGEVDGDGGAAWSVLVLEGAMGGGGGGVIVIDSLPLLSISSCAPISSCVSSRDTSLLSLKEPHRPSTCLMFESFLERERFEIMSESTRHAVMRTIFAPRQSRPVEIILYALFSSKSWLEEILQQCWNARPSSISLPTRSSTPSYSTLLSIPVKCCAFPDSSN